ncbi:hypothetical protein IWX90DRAFT_435342 [Phyllosticta citrichinensis]|uniref:Redoxin domain-containing protein n=1 Tax=Phyllosticta citrichinensis TaxID=1130410 RepID=A0ABR1XQC7_9PEZI
MDQPSSPNPKDCATNDDALPPTHEDVLPNNVPEPKDDHACDHLWGLQLPSGILLRSTSGTAVDVSTLPGLSVIFCYPRTGKPKDPIPADWDAIPGARGCTPQACSFNRTRSSLSDLGIAHIFGLSTQDSEYQRSCKDRLQLRFDLLSDAGYEFCEKLRLPMFEWRDMRLVRRITLLVQQGRVVWVDYPVFPADQSAEKVVGFLKSQPINSGKGVGCGNEE